MRRTMCRRQTSSAAQGQANAIPSALKEQIGSKPGDEDAEGNRMDRMFESIAATGAAALILDFWV